jgi:predicted nucleic-acid-binding protein
MTALDTNVLVRLLTGDDPAQVRAVRRLLRTGQFFLPKTVLVETEWVLRHTYGLDAAVINSAFARLLNYPPLTVEDRGAVLQAVAWHAAGIDFADALHLASSAPAAAFATFDRALAKRARAANAQPAIRLLR